MTDAPDFSRGRTSLEEEQLSTLPDRIEAALKKKGFSDFYLEERKPLSVDDKPLELGKETVDELAEDLDLLSGKWVLFFEENNVLSCWGDIKSMVEEEKIPSAKISTRLQIEKGLQSRYVACVYTEDYTDEKDVMRVKDCLRDKGFEQELHYKPDIYTTLGIYHDNAEEFGLEGVSRYSG